MISPIGINEVLYHNYKKQVNSNDIKSNAYNRNAEYPAYNPKLLKDYLDFIDKFADKYASKVGTGECLVDWDTFREELKEWTNMQPQEKKSELEQMEQRILEIIAAAKRGEIYKAPSKSTLYNFNTTISF